MLDDLRPGDATANLSSSVHSAFGEDVRAGLSLRGQKRLPPKYLYDELGSALFEAITQLPEYGLWRAEKDILANHADEIALLGAAHNVIELGSGSASKTIHLLDALLRRRPISYCGVDLSSSAIDMTRRALAGLPGLTVHTVAGEYLIGLEKAMHFRPANERSLVLFLGSSLGNFDGLAGSVFLRRIRLALRTGDTLLLGVDLEKPRDRLLAAYDDSLGVTAAFNRNLLQRLNRELGANCELALFRHVARFNQEANDIEMHLESRCDQTIDLERLGFSVSLRAGETIHTESSHKYSVAELNRIVMASGFEPRAKWIDEEWQFANCLYGAV